MENCKVSFQEADRILGYQNFTLFNEMRDFLHWYFEQYGEGMEHQPEVYNVYILATAFTAGRVSGIREERARKRVPA